MSIIKNLLSKLFPPKGQSLASSETTPLGKGVQINHTQADTDRAYTGLSAEEMNEIEKHVEKYIGPFHNVLHEIISDGMHLDLILVPAREEFPYNTLVTMGASERAMNVPEGYTGSPFAEYVLFLPKDWPIDIDSWKDERHYWPIRMLKTVSRIPREFNSWLSYGHTIPNGNPPETFDPSTKLSGSIVTFPYLVQDVGFARLNGLNKEVSFFCISAIYENEWKIKIEKGMEYLDELADKQNIPYVLIDPERKEIVNLSGI